jgi:hypothetical protein
VVEKVRGKSRSTLRRGREIFVAVDVAVDRLPIFRQEFKYEVQAVTAV